MGDATPDRPPVEPGKSPAPEEKPSQGSVRRMGDAWMIATILPAALVIGYLAGRGLDKLFSCYPWCTVAFSVIGTVAGFREVIRIAIRVGGEEDRAARGRDDSK
jgi:F0F1-type ATP synthase assembly protein I